MYPWKRYWCPCPHGEDRKKIITYASPDGFLIDPAAEFWGRQNQHLVQLEDLQDKQCAVLLGEPGIGKSTTIRKTLQTLDEQKVKIHAIDLRTYGTAQEVRDAFSKDATIQEWLQGDFVLHLFIDSFDECLLRVEMLPGLLIDTLSALPISRLRLRLVSRTAAWSEPRMKLLKTLYEDAGEYELVSLTKSDVETAAEAEGLDKARFMSEIDRLNIAALAGSPVSLKFLIDLYLLQNALPGSKYEVYYKGCHHLCEEANPYRAASYRRTLLRPLEAMAVASRMAAITMFCNKIIFCEDLENIAEQVSLEKLSGGVQKMDGASVEMTPLAVAQTLSTALFSYRGEGELGWAHMTYAEFFAAEYLRCSEMETGKIIQLITHPDDPHKRVATQFAEIAAWLAPRNTELFDYLIETDPEILLRADLQSCSADQVDRLVASILKVFEQKRSLDDVYVGYGRRHLYERLNHPGLVAQLRPYINDRTKHVIVRRVAVDIAESCETKEVVDDLLRVTLDTSEEEHIRVNTGYAVVRIGTSEQKAALKPLALKQAGADDRDELQGIGLKAVWPEHMSAEELFGSISEPQDSGLVGSYSSFLGDELLEHLHVEDLPHALDWLEELHPINLFDGYLMRRLEHKILKKCWEHFERPEIRTRFARQVYLMLDDRDDLEENDEDQTLRALLTSDLEKKRDLVKAIVDVHVSLPSDERSENGLLTVPRALGLHADLPWVIEQTKQASPEARKAWSHLLRFSFNLHDKKHLFLILKARIPSAHIRAAFRPKELYQRFLIPRRFHERFFLPPALRSRRIPRGERSDVPAAVEACLRRIEAGEAEAWLDLTHAIRNPATDGQLSHIDPDLKKYGGWGLVGSPVQKRIVEAAKAFVKSYEQKSGEWLADGKIPAKGIAGFKALRLLAQEDLPFLQTLAATFWQNIAILILSYPESFTRWSEPDNKLARLVFQNAEDEAVRAFVEDIDAENQRHGTISGMSRVAACWDCGSLLQRTLEQKLRDASLKPSAFAGILRALLAHGSADAKAYAITQAQTSTERKLVASSILFQAANDAGWSIVWPTISSSIIFGRRFIQAVSGGFDEARLDFLKKLTEDQIANLYIWVSQQFPENEDPTHPSGRAHGVGDREEIGMWRDKLLEYLVNRGTLAAYNAMQKIQASGCHDCTYSLVRALRCMRERWIPLTVEQILAMQRDTEKRLVRNADELLDVIVESLQRLEKKLHDANPAVRDIWDATSADKFKPVTENEFSDYVARHLEEDLRRRGIVVNREVWIHRGEHRNDLLITAVQEEPIDIVKVTIETKGCWHDDLMTGMESQLVGDYLTANECQRGIYLIAWFKSDKWDPDNIRRWRNGAQDWTLDAARAQFDQQAERLSTGTLRLQAFVMDAGIRH